MDARRWIGTALLGLTALCAACVLGGEVQASESAETNTLDGPGGAEVVPADEPPAAAAAESDSAVCENGTGGGGEGATLPWGSYGCTVDADCCSNNCYTYGGDGICLS